MKKTLLRSSISALLITVMVATALSIPILSDSDIAFASEGTTEEVKFFESSNTISPLLATNPAYNAKSNLNKHIFTKTLKPGKWNQITSMGNRYSRIVGIYQQYGRDGTKYIQGEEFFMPASINVKSSKKNGLNRTFNFSMYSTFLMYKSFVVKLYSSDVGKYTITTQFRKCHVDISSGTNPTASFATSDSKLYPLKDVFYVQAKVKFAYDKKKGKLSKKKRTKYMNPSEKYGKLPKPKAKKGYKFKGWYTKKKGGKKVTKKTTVPSKTNVTLYARYKKK